MIGTRQTSLFYLESPSGDFYTSPFFLAFASVPPKLPPPEKGLIGEKSSSDHLIGARWYDADLGQFLSVDPAGQYVNPYSYGPYSPMNGSDPTGMMWDIFRPSKWAAAGREVNEYTEKAYNKAFNDECHYETNEHCRGRIENEVAGSQAIDQLSSNCGHGDPDACKTLSAIGWFPGNGESYSFDNNWNRKLAVYIFENGGHKLGATLTAGGGKAAPAVQYDDNTIPLGVYDVSGRPSQTDIDANLQRREAARAEYYASNESRPGDDVFAGAGPLDGDYPLSGGVLSPRSPDFYTLSVNVGPWVGYTFSITVDRYGQVYIAPLGGNFGKSSTLVSGSFTPGYINTPMITPYRASSFLSGYGINVGGGWGIGGGVQFSPSSAIKTGGVFGIYSPQFGASAGYSWMW